MPIFWQTRESLTYYSTNRPSVSFGHHIFCSGQKKLGFVFTSLYYDVLCFKIIKILKCTAGVRILKMEGIKVVLNDHNVTTEVELWDCSGDFKYAKCWPALRRKSQGVIIVCRPEMNDGRSLLPWLSYRY